MATDVAILLQPFKPIEQINIVTGADTGQTFITITFSTSVTTTKEMLIRALTEITEYMEGYVWPPANRTP